MESEMQARTFAELCIEVGLDPARTTLRQLDAILRQRAEQARRQSAAEAAAAARLAYRLRLQKHLQRKRERAERDRAFTALLKRGGK